MNPSEKSNVYRFRAECEPDVDTFRALLADRLLRLDCLRSAPFPDVVCEIEVRDMSHHDMRDLCRAVVDGHVMLETIQPKELYTGEREYGL